MSEDELDKRRYTSSEVVLLEDVYKAIHDRRCGCDREACTDETDYWDAADAVLPIVEDHAKTERKAGAVDALREVRHESRGLIFAYRVRYLLGEHMALYGRRSRER